MQYWFILMPSSSACLDKDLCRLLGMRSLNCPEKLSCTGSGTVCLLLSAQVIQERLASSIRGRSSSIVSAQVRHPGSSGYSATNPPSSVSGVISRR